MANRRGSSWRMRACCVAACALSSSAAVPGAGSAATHDIIIRHDRPDARYRELGERYSATVVEMALPTGSSDRPTRGNGSGTLIRPDWVLTAAHVASVIMPGHSRYRGKAGHVVYLAGQPHQVERVILHPGWVRMDSAADVALVKLTAPVEGGKTACLYPDADEAGQTSVLVGNGLFGTGLTGPVERDSRFRGATVRIEGVKSDGAVLWWPFRAPDDPRVTDLEGISGPGDSGGPAFLMHKGRLCVAGVSSRQTNQSAGEGRYGVHEEYPRVSYFRQWIESTIGDTPTVTSVPSRKLIVL